MRIYIRTNFHPMILIYDIKITVLSIFQNIYKRHLFFIKKLLTKKFIKYNVIFKYHKFHKLLFIYALENIRTVILTIYQDQCHWSLNGFVLMYLVKI